MSDATFSAIGARGNSDRSANPFRSVMQWLGRIGRYRQTLNALAELDDRALHDLGLQRSSIKSVAYQAAYGRR
ncbi:DUF1127 domain-containing protein [Pontibaca methylaminivorans]|mgnify:CR=1 FL=1|uniref:DUF1127 domain-containing protein n=1 Tax=Pontibaca methylaminivorans TaxID=515897 RepID=UPI002FDA3666